MKFDELKPESQVEVDKLLTAFIGDAGHLDASMCKDIESLGLKVNATAAQVSAVLDDPANSDKVIILKPFNSKNNAILYYFGKDYPNADLRQKAFIVNDTKSRKGIITALVTGVSRVSASTKDDKPIGFQTIASDHTTPAAFQFAKVRAAGVPLKFIGHFGKIIKNGLPSLEKDKDIDIKPAQRDVYGVFPTKVLRSVQYEIKNPMKNAAGNAKHNIRRLNKGKNVAKQPIFSDNIQIAYTKGTSDNDKLDVWIHINPNGSTVGGDAIVNDFSTLTIDAIKNSDEWFKITKDRLLINKEGKVDGRIVGNNIVLDTYPAHGSPLGKGSHQKRIIVRVQDDTISRLLSAQTLEEDDPYSTAFLGSIYETQLRNNGSLENLDELRNYTNEQIAAGLLDSEIDKRGIAVEKISQLVRTTGEVVKLVATIVGPVAAMIFAGTAGAGDITLKTAEDAAREVSYQTAQTQLVQIESGEAVANAVVKIAEEEPTVVKGYFNWTYSSSEEGDTYTIRPGKANQIAQSLDSVVDSKEVAKEVAEYGSNYSFNKMFAGGDPYREIANVETARALGEAAALEVASIPRLDLGEGTVIYPASTGDLTSEENWTNELSAKYSNASAIVESYTEAYTTTYENETQISNELPATPAPEPEPLPPVDEINDGEGYYVNNPTLVTTLGSVIGETSFDIKTINVVQPQNGEEGLVTIYATTNDESKAYEVSFLIDSEVNTTKELYEAIQEAKVSQEGNIVRNFENVNNILSKVWSDAYINQYKKNFTRGVKDKYGITVAEGGNAYVSTDSKTGEFEVIYITDDSTVSLPGTAKGRLSDRDLKVVASVSVMGGSYRADSTYTYTLGTYTSYNNQSGTYVEEEQIEQEETQTPETTPEETTATSNKIKVDYNAGRSR